MLTDVKPLSYTDIQDVIRESLYLDINTGKLTWIKISKHHKEKLGKEAGTIRKTHGESRVWIKVNGKAIPRSKIVFFLYNGYWANPVVDHINRNTMDDRPENLREATVEFNNHNHSRRNIRVTANGNFQVRLGKINIGTFTTREKAEQEYDKSRASLWKT